MDASAWDERYRATDLLWSRGPNVFVESRLGEATPGVGVDLASGEGRNAIWLAERGWAMTAVDFSAVAIERGRAMTSDVEFIQADVFSWEPFGDTTSDGGGGADEDDSNLATDRSKGFDLVLIAYLQVEAEPLSGLVSRAIRWLAPGGELFMVGHDLSNIDEGVGGPQVPEILWDLDLMLGWLGGLRVVEGGVVNRPVEADAEIRYARDTLIRARAGDTER